MRVACHDPLKELIEFLIFILKASNFAYHIQNIGGTIRSTKQSVGYGLCLLRFRTHLVPKCVPQKSNV